MKKHYGILWLLLSAMTLLAVCRFENQADAEIVETEKLPRVIDPVEYGVTPVKASANVINGEAAILNIDFGKLKRRITRLNISPKFAGRNIRWEIWAAPFPLGDSPSAQEGALKVAAGTWNYAANAPLYIDFMESDESLVTWRFDARCIQIRQLISGAAYNAAFQENGSVVTLDAYGHFPGNAIDKTRLGEACARAVSILQGMSIRKAAYKPLYAELHGEYDEQGLLIRYGALREMSQPENTSLPPAVMLARQLDIDARTETLCDRMQDALLIK